jgi:hypothetical protein
MFSEYQDKKRSLRDSLVKKLDCGRSCNLASLGSLSRRIT